MAIIDFIANAVRVPQIVTRAIGGTWLSNETITCTINGKDLVITVGTPVTTTDVAALIAAAINATDRLDAATGSSNVGGQAIPEVSEIIASSDAAVLTLTTRNSSDFGVPFTITFATDSASGTIGSETVVQAATGPNHWDNADNWSGGNVPADDDVVQFRDSNVDCSYGLPDDSREVLLILYNSWTGELGLPKVRNFGSAKAYFEYRQRYLRLDDAGSGATMTHVIGRGPGEGPRLVNIRQSVLATTFEINNNRQQSIQGEQYVHNLIAPAGATFRVARGSVQGGNQDAATAAVTAVNISGIEQQISGIDVDISQNATASLTVNQVGGRLTLSQTSWSSNGITMRGGEIVKRCPCPSMIWADGTIFDEGTGTVVAGTMNNGAVLDVSRGSGALTITNITRHPGSAIKDPAKRITHSNAVVTTGKIADVLRNDDYGYGRSYQISG